MPKKRIENSVQSLARFIQDYQDLAALASESIQGKHKELLKQLDEQGLRAVMSENLDGIDAGLNELLDRLIQIRMDFDALKELLRGVLDKMDESLKDKNKKT